MRSLINHLLPSSIIVSILSLGIAYFFLYRWQEGGYTESEVLYSLVITIPIFLFFSTSIHLVFINSYGREIGLHEKRMSNFKIFLFLSLTTIVFSIILDKIYYNFDTDLFKNYSREVSFILKQNGDERYLNDFESLTFFKQTIFQNIFGILVGSSLSTFIFSKRAEKKQIIN